MRVKKNAADDLVDALKQLKITDRRSRLSFRARSAALGGLSFLKLPHSPCSFHSANPDITAIRPDFPHACEYCVLNYQPHVGVSEWDDTRQHTETSSSLSGHISPLSLSRCNTLSYGSGFAPFTASAGLLHSTLPTTFEFATVNWEDRDIRLQTIQSNRLRRSCGAGLSYLTHESLDGSITASSSSRVTSTVDRHHCCIHYGTSSAPSNTQSRLYRRIYSLVDHPCVSLYRTLSHPTTSDTHAVFPKFSHRSQSTRHRYPRQSLVSEYTLQQQQQQPISNRLCSSRDSVIEVLPGEPKCTSFAQSTKPITQQRCSVQFGSSITDQSTGAPALFHQLDGSDFRLLPCRRVRRNSDPQQWQQNRPEEPGISNGSSLGPPSALTIFSSASTQRCTMKSDDKPITSLNLTVRPGNFNFQPDDAAPMLCQQPSRGKVAFRPMPPDQNTSVQSSLCFFPSSTTSNRPACFSRFVPQLRAVQQHTEYLPSGDITPQSLSDSKLTLCNQPACESHPPQATGDADNPHVMRSLAHELSMIEQTESACDTAGLDGATRPLTTDVSVNELASYMEHMVHIPGRMSEMAQRMYL